MGDSYALYAIDTQTGTRTRIPDVVEIISTGLKHSARPPYCARVLCGCLHILDGRSPRWQPYAFDVPYFTPQCIYYESFREMYPEYLSRCAAFLSLPRSDREKEDLDAAISKCPCSSTRLNAQMRMLLTQLHKFKPNRQFHLVEVMQSLIRHLAGVLHDAVRSQTVGGTPALSSLKRHARRHSASPPWPTDPSQLIPHGLEESVRGYAYSFRITLEQSVKEDVASPDHPNIISAGTDRFQETLLLIAQLLAICGRSIMPHLFQYNPEWSLRISGLAASVVSERKESLGKPVDIDMERSWQCSLYHILDFSNNISGVGVRNPTDMELLVRVPRPAQWQSQNMPFGSSGLLFVCNLLLCYLPLFREGTTLFTEEFVDTLQEGFSGLGAQCYLYKSPDDDTVCHPAILQHMKMYNPPDADPSRMAFIGFAWAAQVRHCCAPECRETFATAKRAFARCAGCGVLRYCSRECQRNGWKHHDATLAHKNFCKKLRVLKERTNHPSDQDPWIISRDSQSFVDICRADEGLAALAQDCAQHLNVLMNALRDNSEAIVPEGYQQFMQSFSTSGVAGGVQAANDGPPLPDACDHPAC